MKLYRSTLILIVYIFEFCLWRAVVSKGEHNLFFVVIWPIVKAMLTTKEMEYLKKCEKKEIDQYIDKDQLEPHMLKHLK